jgi:undecaprenyl-diphosphatase
MLGGPFLVGIAVAALSGTAAIWALLRWVQTRSLAPFVVYRLALGLLLLFV